MRDQKPFDFTDQPAARAERRAREVRADEALVSALGQAARAVAADEPAGPSPAAWHRLTRARAQPERRAPRALVWGALGAAACASVLAVLVVSRQVRPSSLTYDLRGGGIASSGQVEAGPQGTALRFSDGTEIDLDAKGRLAVSDAGPHGARVRLQAGAAHFRVMHLPHAAWTVEAGPYVVEVTGTEFDVRWSEREQTVEVKMVSGSVRVSGPLLTERVALGKGQHLLARPGMGEVRIDDGRPAVGLPAGAPPVTGAQVTPDPVPAAPAPAVEPVRPTGIHPRPRRRLALSDPGTGTPASVAATDAEREGTTDRAPASGRNGDTHAPAEAAVAPPPLAEPRPGGPVSRWRARNWPARVAAGDASAVVADAESVGLDATMRQADAGDLTALADAARYAGRPELAERAFSATRRRFPGSSRAHTAAFLLGRMADDRGEEYGGLRWYRAYLAEAPTGPYAAEALGREMLIVQRMQGREGALPIAREYLARFPNGTYLLEARALIDNR